MVNQYQLGTVNPYMQFVQDNAEESVTRAIDILKDGSFIYEIDSGAIIQVSVTIDRYSRRAKVDSIGTSAQLNSNFNTPKAVTQAAVLYVFRTLADDNIPLNAGCLKPLEIIVPKGRLYVKPNLSSSSSSR
jgi:N-methylhydantoinase B